MKFLVTIIVVVVVMGLAIVVLTAKSPETTDIETPDLFITNYAEALKTAKEANKPILIDFTGSDWCSWCIKLDDEVFSQPEFIEFATKNLILFKADFPSQNVEQPIEVKEQNAPLLKKYGIEGFPTIILIDGDENIIAQTGYQFGGAMKYVEHLKELLGKDKI